MTIQTAVDLVSSTLWMALIVIAPLVGTGIVVGLIVSITQSITSIQEQSLTFVPKLVAVSFVMMYLGNWILVQITDFTDHKFREVQFIAPSQQR